MNMVRFNTTMELYPSKMKTNINAPKGTSLIKWQTGEPKEEDTYLITYQLDETTNVTTFLFYFGRTWVNGDCKEIDESKVIAWCKLSDIEPYKE